MEKLILETQREHFDFSAIKKKFVEKDSSLRLNRAVAPKNADEHTAPLEVRRGTWASGAYRNESRDKVLRITIGEDNVPDAESKIFNWGTSGKDDELMVKGAHECAHEFQLTSGLESAMTSYLNGARVNFSDKEIAYIGLYQELANVRSIPGLSTLGVYEDQSKRANMNVSALEDITELLGAYFLGDEYFSWRLEHTRVPLSQAQKEKIAELIMMLYPD